MSGSVQKKRSAENRVSRKLDHLSPGSPETAAQRSPRVGRCAETTSLSKNGYHHLSTLAPRRTDWPIHAPHRRKCSGTAQRSVVFVPPVRVRRWPRSALWRARLGTIAATMKSRGCTAIKWDSVHMGSPAPIIKGCTTSTAAHKIGFKLLTAARQDRATYFECKPLPDPPRHVAPSRSNKKMGFCSKVLGVSFDLG